MYSSISEFKFKTGHPFVDTCTESGYQTISKHVVNVKPNSLMFIPQIQTWTNRLVEGVAEFNLVVDFVIQTTTPHAFLHTNVLYI